MPSIREQPPLRQHIEAITPSGRYYRWGEDELLPKNVFSDLRHSSTMPGGYESMEVTLPRRPEVDYSDLERLTTLRVIGAGGQVDGEYRLERAPRTSGDQMAISPSAVGWQAHLEDDKSAIMPYRDVDLSRWSAPNNVRQLGLSNVTKGSFSAASGDSGAAALIFNAQGVWGLAAGFRAEAYWRAPSGTNVARVRFAWATNTSTGTDSNFTLVVYTTDDEVTFPDQSADALAGAASGTLDYATATPRQEMLIQFGYPTGPAGTSGADYEVSLTEVAVYGDHGLTLRGTEPNAGFYASDIVVHAVQTWAPQLQIAPESVQQSSFVIPHLSFTEPTTAGEIIRQASRFNLPDWGVWEDKEFVWYAQGTRGKRWRARIGPSQLEETGPQLERLWESIVVQYQDVDGRTRTVGPPGSGADVESALLKDYDTENPANQLGIIRRDMLVIGVSVSEAAITVGSQFLEQTKTLDRSGRAQIVGWVEDDRGVSYPYSRVRAGDYISFVDASDTSYRRIVRADHTRSTRSCSIDLDAPPDGLAQLLERWGAVLVPLGL